MPPTLRSARPPPVPIRRYRRGGLKAITFSDRRWSASGAQAAVAGAASGRHAVIVTAAQDGELGAAYALGAPGGVAAHRAHRLRAEQPWIRTGDAGGWPVSTRVSAEARPEHRLASRSASPASPSRSHFAAARCHADEV